MEESDEVILKVKEKKYRGKTLDELKVLDVRETSKYLTSQSRRAILRNFDVIERFVRSCEKRIGRKKKIKTHKRDLIVVPRLVGMTIGIHNGKEFQDVIIMMEMVGHRLGEFAPTRGIVKHSAAGIGATKGSKAKKK